MSNIVYLDLCCAISVETSPAITARGSDLCALGFGTLDALHLAFAEAAAARWFVTTDDRLVKLGLRHREHLIVEVVGLIAFDEKWKEGPPHE